MNIEDYYSIINKMRTGLTLVPLRTGMSKTHTAMNFIEDIHSKGIENYKRIVFISNKKNNIPYEELKKIYEKSGEILKFNTEVFYLESNFDSIIRRLPNSIPNSTRPKVFEELRRNIDMYINSSSSDVNDRKFIKSLIDSDNMESGEFSLEKKFRMEIKGILNKAVNNSNDISKKKDIIRNNKDYKWIADVYPQIFMESYKVILMNTSKFNTYYDSIIGGSKRIISDDLITKDSIIIFDEFDQTKKVILNNILDNSMKNKGSIFNDFISFGQVLNQDITTRIPEISNINTQNKLEELKKEYECIQNKYYVQKTWFLNSKHSKHGFIFFNGSVTSLINGNSKNKLINVFSENDNQVNMNISSQNFSDDSQNNSIDLIGSIFSINKFFLHLRNYFLQIAQKITYRESTQLNDQEAKRTPTDILFSVMGLYKLNGRQREILLEDIYFSKSKERKIEIMPGMNSLYDFGLKTIFLENKQSNTYVTEFNTFNVWNTPESIMLSLCKGNHVIGLSATATIQSNLVNYDLFYLQKQLGMDYINAFEILTDETKKKIRTMDNSYSKNKVNIQTESTDDIKAAITDDMCGDQGELKGILRKLFEIDVNSASNIARELSVLEIDKYSLQRYFEVIKAMIIFLQHKKVESFLCLTQKGVKNGKDSFKKETLSNILTQLIINYDYKSEVKLEILVGDNFESKKRRILGQLNKGEKIFLMSTYATLGDGQNLQYKPATTDNLIKIVDNDFSSSNDQRFQKKDFDGIYLGEVTSITENLLSDTFGIRSFLNYLIQIEYLAKGYEITPKEEAELLKTGMRRMSNEETKKNFKNISLKKKISVRRAALITVIQAIGRLTRTFLKKEIQILISYDLLLLLPFDELKVMEEEKLLSQEMKEICMLGEKLIPNVNKLKYDNLSKEIDIKSQNFEVHLNKLLNGFNNPDKQWTINFYEKIKRDCLLNPTIDLRKMGPSGTFEFYVNIKGKKQYSYGYDKDNENYYYDKDNKVIGSVSLESSRLPIMLKCPIVKDYFIKNGYATEFVARDYMLSPVLFKNIYKGTIGEMAGVAIFENKLNLKLKRFMKKGYYEYFDYSLSNHDDILFDFKNWDSRFDKDSDKELKRVSDKLDKVNGKIAFVINIAGDKNWKTYQTNDNRIYIIPSLIDDNGDFNKENLNIIFKIIEKNR